MKTKGLLLILICLASLSVIAVSYAPPTPVVYIEPPHASANPGDIFTIGVNIADVVDLHTWQIKFDWNPNILQCIDVSEGPFVKNVNPTVFMYAIFYNYIDMAVHSGGADVGASGSGTLATVTFRVRDAGWTNLDIYDSLLLDPMFAVISHGVEDGYFSTPQEASLVQRRAWPESRHFVISKDEDGNQTLSAKVENIGPPGWSLDVYVQFDLVRDDGYVTSRQTGIATLASGETATLTVDFGPLATSDKGKYYTTVTCRYAYTGAYWARGTKAKTFSFAVTP